VTLHVITGPPASGKTHWVKQHAKRNDITIDFDAIPRLTSKRSIRSGYLSPA
jgi:predicted kinase